MPKAKSDFTNFIDARPNYFPGQFLLEDDFEIEQKYFIDRQKYHRQSLHVSGIIEGLEVVVMKDKQEVVIRSGSGINSNGDLIILKKDTYFSQFTTLTVGELYISYREEKQVKQQEDFTRWQEVPTIAFAATTPNDGVKLAKISIVNNVPSLDLTVRSYSGIFLPNATGSDLTLRSGGDTNPNMAILNGSLTVTGTITGRINSENLTVTNVLKISPTGAGANRAWMTQGMSVAWDSDVLFVGLKDEGANRKDAVIAWGDDPQEDLRFIHVQSAGDLNGTDIIRLKASGNVGIGTATPSEKLEVGGNLKVTGTITGNINATNINAGTLNADRIPNLSADKITSGTISGNLSVTGALNADSLILGPTNASHLRLGYHQDYSWIQSHGNKPLVINTSNNVGIGSTVNPIASLDISSASRTDTHPTAVKGLYVTGNFNADSDGVEFRHSNGSQGIGFGFNTIYAAGRNANQDLSLKPKGTGEVTVSGNLKVTGTLTIPGSSDTNNLAFLQARNDSSNRNIGLRIRTQKQGTTNPEVVEALTISSTGNVGIGTITPTTRLHVVSANTTSSEVLRVAHSDTDFISVESSSQTGAGNLQFISWSNGWNINTKGDGKHLYLNRDSGATSNVFVGRAGQEFVVTGNGNVGIGTTAPSEKLEVSGNLKVTGTITGNINVNATNINAGTLNADRIPDLSANKITSGVLDVARIANNSLSSDKIISLSADKITSGTIQGSLTINTGGVSGWDKLVINTTSNWGDGNDKQYVTIGAGSGSGIMLNNPHVSWQSGDKRASIRYGRAEGKSTGSFWDVGVRERGAFSFALNATDHTLSISSNGNVGIGTTSPTAKLEVRDTFKLSSSDNEFTMSLRGHCLVFQIKNALVGGNNSNQVISWDGDNNWDQGSDIRLKTDIENEVNILSRLMQLEVKNYRWKDNPNKPTKNIGFIAQDVQPLFPSLVGELKNEDGNESTLTLKYGVFSVLAIGALRELKMEKDAEIKALKTQIEELKKGNVSA